MMPRRRHLRQMRLDMKTELRFGILFGSIAIAYVLVEHVLGFNSTRHDIRQYTRLAGVLIPVLGIFFGIKAKRDSELSGALSFGQGVRTGFLIAVIQTTITTIWLRPLWKCDQPGVSRYAHRV